MTHGDEKKNLAGPASRGEGSRVLRDMGPPPTEPAFDLAALRRLDPGVVDAVVCDHAPRLTRYLSRLGASREVAEELVQECFVRLVRHAPRLRDDTRISAWLFTVARNLYRSHRRWAWVDGTRLIELAWQPRSPTPTPGEAAAASELGARMEAALTAMPQPQREVAMLVIVEGLDPAEAAEILGISAEAARQRLARARARFQEELS